MPNDRHDPLSRFVAELRRRGVLRVAAAYLVGGWVAIEVASVLVPELLLPAWIPRAVIVLVIAGLPAALVLSWAFDLTHDGLRRDRREGARTEEADSTSPEGRGRLRPVAFAGVAAAVVGVGALWVTGRGREAREREAMASVPVVRELAGEGRYAEAYELAVDAERALPSDSALAELWPEISDLLTVRTEPEGARVTARALVADSVEAGERFLGTTPLTDLRIPRAPHHLRIELDGYATEERLASSTFGRSEASTTGRTEPNVVIEVGLVPDGEAVDGMVYVPGGEYTLVSPDVPLDLRAHLDGYFADRFEVTNADFRAFVAAGGYARAELWPSPLVVGGADTLTLDDVRARFVDRTGLPGPRGWSSQVPPAGREDHPVTGVSWYEAAAYCAFREKRLPSIFQWEKAARDGMQSHRGVVMPWGLATAAGAGLDVPRANVSGTGTVPVDAHPEGISPYGAYAMAGNVKEWLANPVGAGRTLTGGSWEDPPYLFPEVGVADPASTSPALGFRCARVRATDARRTRDQGTFALDLDRRTPSYEPVGRAGYEALLSHYRYDPRPLEAEVVQRIETPEWVRETVTFAGADGDRVMAYLWLPKSTPAPHQVIVYVPGSGAFFGAAIEAETETHLGGLIRSGRAVFAVVLKGMVGRPFEPGYEWPTPSSVRFRDLMVRHSTELRLGLDYLGTRSDVDADRIAYAGLSFGAGSRLVFAATDDRYAAVVLIGGGIDERVKPTLPEADNVNFAPYIEAPTLLLNGRQDEEHPWLTRALPLWNLLTEPKELELVDGAGHIPPPEALIPTIDRFLDRVLGPVR